MADIPTLPEQLVDKPRLQREFKTVSAMITLYCRNHRHGGDPLCGNCRALLDYATRRLFACPFQHEKPTCANCRIHCYKPSMREKIREIMRYAGPRLILRHPFLAVAHLMDGWRSKKTTSTSKNTTSNGEFSP